MKTLSTTMQVFHLVVIVTNIYIASAFNNFFSSTPTITTPISTTGTDRNSFQQAAEDKLSRSSSDNNIHQGTETTSITTIMNRRSLLMGTLFAVGTANALTGGAMIAQAAEDTVVTTASPAVVTTDMESVYFGVGCFWHIQHEFIVAERELLGRSDTELTSFTGYAGGTSSDKFNRVCYHNFQNVADYGKYGHGEVVGMKLPTNKIVDFTKVYFSLYDPKTKDRVDPQDRGGEYRSLIGLPGGILHPLYPAIEEAASQAGFTLQKGKGNDPDTLGKQLVYVYDTATFPFYQAEVYHQYHNDFQSPAYGAKYNKLADLAFADGRIKTTGCPDKV